MTEMPDLLNLMIHVIVYSNFYTKAIKMCSCPKDVRNDKHVRLNIFNNEHLLGYPLFNGKV